MSIPNIKIYKKCTIPSAPGEPSAARPSAPVLSSLARDARPFAFWFYSDTRLTTPAPAAAASLEPDTPPPVPRPIAADERVEAWLHGCTTGTCETFINFLYSQLALRAFRWWNGRTARRGWLTFAFAPLSVSSAQPCGHTWVWPPGGGCAGPWTAVFESYKCPETASWSAAL